MKIAFATKDTVHINAHFGAAKQIDIYDVNTEGYTLAEAVTFGGNLQQDGTHDKLFPKFEALKHCTIVYVADIGPGAAARLINKNITPIKPSEENAAIADVLNNLVLILQGNPPPWLRKALRRDVAPSFEEVYVEIEEEVTV